jgi:hypothetical protein
MGNMADPSESVILCSPRRSTSWESQSAGQRISASELPSEVPNVTPVRILKFRSKVTNGHGRDLDGPGRRRTGWHGGSVTPASHAARCRIWHGWSAFVAGVEEAGESHSAGRCTGGGRSDGDRAIIPPRGAGWASRNRRGRPRVPGGPGFTSKEGMAASRGG